MLRVHPIIFIIGANILQHLTQVMLQTKDDIVTFDIIIMNTVFIVPIDSISFLLMGQIFCMRDILKIGGIIPISGQQIRCDALVIE